MSNTPHLVPPRSEGTDTEAALKRLLNSERFRKNPSLRHLLEYLVTRTLQGEQNQIKETTVAVDVFGRPHDFDSRIDNIVRVQAHRLRKLLTSYYESEGIEEKVRFSIPRGGYIPHIERLASPEVPPVLEEHLVSSVAVLEPARASVPAEPRSRSGSVSPILLGFAAGVLVCLGVMGIFRVARPEFFPRSMAGETASGSLAPVWGALLKPGLPCVVSFSNPVFLAASTSTGRRIYLPYTGVLSLPPGARLNISPSELNLSNEILGQNPTFFFNDGWTGVGEVAAMHRLTALFSAAVSFQVVRSRALTYSDIKDSNVIFLGSPWANDMQKKINVGVTPLVNDNEGNILNLKPLPGEPASFRAQVDGANQQVIATYGLFSRLPGVGPGTRVFISAGVDTYATAGVIDFMTSPAGIREVTRRLSGAGHHGIPDFFQAVVRSEMIRGEPAESRLVLAKPVQPGDSHGS